MSTLSRMRSEELARIASAAMARGWNGVIRGLVLFGGVNLYAVTRAPVHFGGPGSWWLTGCLVPCVDPRERIQRASLLAGYCRRAFVAQEAVDAIDLLLQSAPPDQGVVVQSGRHSTALAWPGEVVASPLQHNEAWRRDDRWRRFPEVASGRCIA